MAVAYRGGMLEVKCLRLGKKWSLIYKANNSSIYCAEEHIDGKLPVHKK